MKYIKKYWLIWLILLLTLLLLLFLPKIVDSLFSYSVPMMALYYLKPSDVMSYVNNVITVLITVITASVAALFAWRQFVLQNRTYIVPISKQLYFYADKSFAPPFISDKNNLPAEDISSFRPPQNEPIVLTMKNIGKGTASNFEVTIDWSEGKPFYDLMSKLGYNDYQGYRSDWKPDIYKDVGVFTSDESRSWVLPDQLKSILYHLCQAECGCAPMKRNCLIRTKYKMASISIISSDIMDINDKRTKFQYDLMIEIDGSVSPFSKNYLRSEITITFNKH